MPKSAVLILAAGKGTRLKSQLPKVLHQAGGKTLLGHVIDAARGAGIAAEDIYVVAGYAADRIRDAVAPLGLHVILQEPQQGTGHAVQVAAPSLQGYDRLVVLHGDMPLVSASTVRGLLDTHAAQQAAAVLATATPPSPRAYGRILRQGEDVLGIVEDKQCTPAQKQIRELNAGFYCFSTAALWKALGELRTDNPHGEYYLTDTAAILARRGERVRSFHLEDTEEILGINDRVELVEVDRLIRQRKVRALLENGVTVYSPESVVVDNDVEVGADTVIEAGVHLLGSTCIGAECHIRTGSILENTRIGDGVTVKAYCVLESAEVGAGAQIGPYSRLREGATIGGEAHIGNFVEVKKSKVGRGTKAMHLAYLGDAEVGAGVNIGAGTITCNYDGQKKHRTGIGDGSFVGSNSTLVAPVEIGAGTYIGAGSVITEAVPADSLALGRSRQTVKAGWAEKRRTRGAAAAEKH